MGTEVMMQRELVLQKLKEQGCRMTKQRQILLDIILQEECACSKEIYYKAAAIDSGIGGGDPWKVQKAQ